MTALVSFHSGTSYFIIINKERNYEKNFPPISSSELLDIAAMYSCGRFPKDKDCCFGLPTSGEGI
jgi:hypothetical protein